MDDRILVFLGPTLPIRLAQELIVADFMPPAKQADIYSAVRNSPPSIIVLIDGEFNQALSVWHKEILFALAQGVRVIGASSMGALRAAELHSLGMTGVGKIFEDYRDGIIDADDEVALTYGPAEIGYPQTTIPLVNLRATVENAERSEVITLEEKYILMGVLKNIHFSVRTKHRIRQEMVNRGFSTADFEKIIVNHFIDQKMLDAIVALETAKAISSVPKSLLNTPEFRKTHSLNVVDQQDRLTHDGFRRREIAKFISLTQKDFSSTLGNALNRTLSILLGKMMSIEASAMEIDEQAKMFRSKFSIVDDLNFDSWLRLNDVNLEDFSRLMRENAICQKLYRWLLSTMGACEHTQSTLDFITLQNEYSVWKDKLNACNDLKSLVVPSSMDDTDLIAGLSLNQLLELHSKHHPRLTNGALVEWMKDVGFQGEDDFKNELLKVVLGDRAKEQLLAFVSQLQFGAEIEKERKSV